MQENGISQMAELAGAASSTQPNASHRILVVEDDAELREQTRNLLLCAGYAVDAAAHGGAAWDALQLRRYDLMVTDNQMPKLTGIELLQMLHVAGVALPVIMATGILPEAEFSRSPWLRPGATLLKPFSDSQLLATVEALLHGSDRDRGPIKPAPNSPVQPGPQPAAGKLGYPIPETSVHVTFFQYER